jgi:hypothetical protein
MQPFGKRLSVSTTVATPKFMPSPRRSRSTRSQSAAVWQKGNSQARLSRPQSSVTAPLLSVILPFSMSRTLLPTPTSGSLF